jgi:hypothetical protein
VVFSAWRSIWFRVSRPDVLPRGNAWKRHDVDCVSMRRTRPNFSWRFSETGRMVCLIRGPSMRGLNRLLDSSSNCGDSFFPRKVAM